ncbi:MAG TPA: nitroreductase/quinone reductase family protein [Acidimicrobiia bacterium]|nr:nitroreductase/quinone reductase family protein [Acidimicrobiia bacterium]
MLELPPGGTRGAEIPGVLRPMMRAMSGIGNLMMRFGVKIQGRPLLRLITIGAKTGQRRESVLGWFEDPSGREAWLVVASNSGSSRHPGWAFNLARSPKEAWVDLGDGEFPVEAELLAGDERTDQWDRVVALAPGYGNYVEKTDREIPIFRLSRVGE